MAERNIEMLGQMLPNCLTEAKSEKDEFVGSIDFVQIFKAYSKRNVKRILK